MNLAQLNDVSRDDALRWLHGLYEHSPWVAEAVVDCRPYASAAQLKHLMAQAVRDAPRDLQLALLCAHPELAGRLAEQGGLTAESASEQERAGLKACSPDEHVPAAFCRRAYRCADIHRAERRSRLPS